VSFSNRLIVKKIYERYDERMGVSVILYTPHYAAIAENYVLLSRMLKLPVSMYIRASLRS